jgi:hypothetical protein
MNGWSAALGFQNCAPSQECVAAIPGTSPTVLEKLCELYGIKLKTHHRARSPDRFAVASLLSHENFRGRSLDDVQLPSFETMKANRTRCLLENAPPRLSPVWYTLLSAPSGKQRFVGETRFG